MNHEFNQFVLNAERLKSNHGLSTYDLIDIILKNKSHKLEGIPLEIFDNNQLSCLESVVKFMKENLSMKSGAIALALNRDISTIATTYRNAARKMSSSFILRNENYHVPFLAFTNRKFSVLESLVSHLRERKYKNSQIARLLNRDSRTVWTVFDRYKKKSGVR